MDESQRSRCAEKKVKLLQLEKHYLTQAVNFISGTVFWKDADGVYLGHNKRHHQQLIDNGILQTENNQIIGLTDHDVFPKSVAKEYRKNDISVMEKGKELFFHELTHDTEKMHHLLFSIKRPLLDIDNNIVGVIGNTIDFSYIDLGENHVSLSQRELQCYAGLFMGMTAKEMGKHFSLSNKTIEAYLATVKKKLDCDNKYQLIKIALQNNLEKIFISVLDEGKKNK